MCTINEIAIKPEKNVWGFEQVLNKFLNIALQLVSRLSNTVMGLEKEKETQAVEIKRMKGKLAKTLIFILISIR